MRHAAMILLIALLTQTGCKVGPDYHRPNVATPLQWRAQVPVFESVANIPWQEFFHDPVLKELIGVALTNNYDIRIAVTRIEQAQGSYRIQRAGLFPSLDASAGWTRASNPV